ncbi:MAG: hypothetical protein KAS12_01640 [Candidatus Aenigmarchaeota archaeon]|nr:hypothetical protein [Candidatus Aenigmarchaeota archaeon]
MTSITKCKIITEDLTPYEINQIGKNMGFWVIKPKDTVEGVLNGLVIMIDRWNLIKDQENIKKQIALGNDPIHLNKKYKRIIEHHLKKYDIDVFYELTLTLENDTPINRLIKKFYISQQNRVLQTLDQVITSNKTAFQILSELDAKSTDPVEQAKYQVAQGIFDKGAADILKFTGVEGGITWLDYGKCLGLSRSELIKRGYKPSFEDDQIIPLTMTNWIPIQADEYIRPDYLMIIFFIILIAIVYFFVFRNDTAKGLDYTLSDEIMSV